MSAVLEDTCPSRLSVSLFRFYLCCSSACLSHISHPSLVPADAYFSPPATYRCTSPSFHLSSSRVITYTLKYTVLSLFLVFSRTVTPILLTPFFAHPQRRFIVDLQSPVHLWRNIPSNCAIRLNLFMIPLFPVAISPRSPTHPVYSSSPRFFHALSATYTGVVRADDADLSTGLSEIKKSSEMANPNPTRSCERCGRALVTDIELFHFKSSIVGRPPQQWQPRSSAQRRLSSSCSRHTPSPKGGPALRLSHRYPAPGQIAFGPCCI